MFFEGVQVAEEEENESNDEEDEKEGSKLRNPVCDERFSAFCNSNSPSSSSEGVNDVLSDNLDE